MQLLQFPDELSALQIFRIDIGVVINSTPNIMLNLLVRDLNTAGAMPIVSIIIRPHFLRGKAESNYCLLVKTKVAVITQSRGTSQLVIVNL